MSKNFDAAICLNGHCISDSKETESLVDKFCEQCGAKIIFSCPSCSEHIRGKINSEYSYLSTYTSPAYCWECGQAFPWTAMALASTIALIQEDDQLSEVDQSRLIESLPDVIAETPKTQLATVRIRKALLIAGQYTSDALRQFTIDFACEVAKKLIQMP